MGFNNNIESPEKFCSNCGEQIDVRAEICPHCGVRVAMPPSVKNPAVALVLSFFVVGLGQVYNGKYKTAILMFVLAVISAMLWSIGIGVITSLIIWIWSMSNAWNVAKGTGGSTSGSVNTVVMAVVGFLLICALMAMIGAFVFGVGDSIGGDTVTTSTYAPTPPVETATSVQKTPTELNLKVGETANTSKIAVTVISASKTDSYVYYSDILKETMIEQASPGHTFVLAEMEIKNIGSDRAYVGSTGFSMVDSEGYRHDPEILYYGNDGLEMFKELYQHQKMRGKVLFKVPKDAQKLKIQYDFGNLFTKVKLASWALE